MSDSRALETLGLEFPLLPLKDIVIFPHMVAPVFTSEDLCVNAISNAMLGDKKIFLSTFCRSVKEGDHPSSLSPPFDVYDTGLVCSILRTRKLSDGRVKALVQGISRATVVGLRQAEPFPSVMVQPVIEHIVYSPPAEIEALMRSVRDNLAQVASLGKVLPPDLLVVLEGVRDPGRLSDLAVAHLSLKLHDAQNILITSDPVQRLRRVHSLLAQEMEVFRMQAKIQTQTQEEIGKVQKEYYLREQIKVMRNELGDVDTKDEIADLWQEFKKVRLTPRARDEVLRNLKRLERMHQDTSEASLTRSYVEQMLALPWQIYTEDNLNLRRVKGVLDEDHFGLLKIKDRIIEYLAVKKLNPDAAGPILCFVGPPGVGKTSLGRSIARAMGRKFARISLGGVQDEADIRGHRRTYVGAYPGRIVQSLKHSESSNPVLMLDEIDKIGVGHRGDPASALLEALDPEQNATFVDHYLGVEFNLSRVLFIANANTVVTVPHALRDRLELIDISGYSVAEKVSIANRFLVPRQLERAGLSSNGVQVAFSRAAITKVINSYTKESGLRTLEKRIASVCRKVARRVVESDNVERDIKITPRQIERQLGAGYIDDVAHTEPQVGVALALAYTPLGGDILAIETNILRNSKPKLKLTGQVGEVMNESAHAALSFIIGNASFFGFDAKILTENEVHVHVPAGATPKDGPSAGVTITTAILSSVLGVSPPRTMALTGEITLHGRVLAVGGLKEKLLAAQRYRIFEVLVPAKNRPSILELSNDVKKNMKIQYIDNYFNAFNILFNMKERTPFSETAGAPPLLTAKEF